MDTVVKPRYDTERFSKPRKQASCRNDITDITLSYITRLHRHS
ncbi:MAG TPA: hypothetical protein LFW21_07105 [Rickettsia endosymbiont of Pyrocoelia pectoralis]|nr:hypothetical protein [Rickettsia endosymbiont of Pyrocoelia pectoralis]